LAGGQSGRLPPPGEKSVAFNTSFTQELKAFLKKLIPFPFRPCGSLQDSGKNRVTKAFRPTLSKLNSDP